MIYFIREGDDGLIKIGFSASESGVRERLATLQVGNGRRLVLLATRCGSKFEEADLHERFAHARRRGEWFEAVPELLEYVGRGDTDELLDAAGRWAEDGLVDRTGRLTLAGRYYFLALEDLAVEDGRGMSFRATAAAFRELVESLAT